MALSERQLNRSTLARQLLLEREQLGLFDGLDRVAALQAQAPPSPYLALWNRLEGFDPDHLDDAFADGRVVKASLMRLTLHAVLADDHPAFYAAMLPSLRAARLGDRRYLDAGLTVDEADSLLPELIAHLDEPRTNEEVLARVAELRGQEEPWLWWAYRTFAPLRRAPTGGPWTFDGTTAYVAASLEPAVDDHGDGVRWLVRRYLAAFGPASVPDIAQFTLLRRAVIKRAIEELGDDVVDLVGPGGASLVDLAGALEVPDADVPAPVRLLPMWDSTLLAYADRSRVLPAEYRATVIRRNGDVLPSVLIDGYVAGVWRPLEGGVEVSAFEPLAGDVWEQLDAEAHSLRTFLDAREPVAYRRYHHWWDKGLPSVEVRLLGTHG